MMKIIETAISSCSSCPTSTTIEFNVTINYINFFISGILSQFSKFSFDISLSKDFSFVNTNEIMSFFDTSSLKLNTDRIVKTANNKTHKNKLLLSSFYYYLLYVPGLRITPAIAANQPSRGIPSYPTSG